MSSEKPNNSYVSSLINSVSKQVLDLKNTSVESALRLMMTDFFKNDNLKNVKEFQGEIVRIVIDKKEFNFSPYNIINSLVNTNPYRYKVWIPDLGSLLTSKTPSDDNPNESVIIDLLPDFVIANSSITNISVKDIVTVAFLDPVNFKNGVIKSKANKSSTGEAGSNNNGGVPTKPAEAFPTPVPTPKPKEEVRPQPNEKPIPPSDEDIDLKLYKWDIAPNNSNVVESGKSIKGRKVPTNPAEGKQHYLAVEAAEAFKEMAKALKEEKGLTLLANSGYRSAQKQIELFDQRWTLKYETGRNKRLNKTTYGKKGGENELNSIGKSQGVAAEPSPSGPHLGGYAVDISVGSPPKPSKGQEPKTARDNLLAKFKTDIYLWLNANAYKYGFFNTGANIQSTPEAWHWVYKRELKGKKEATILPPNSLKSDK